MAGSLMPYVQALYESAAEAGSTEAVEKDLEQLDAVLKQNPDYTAMLGHPGVTREQKAAWLTELTAGAEPLLTTFLTILAHHGLAGQISGLYAAWKDCVRQANEIETVLVETPAPLSAKDEAALTAMLESRLKRKIELTVRVEPDLIAGLRVRARDLVLDNTVRSRLNTMREQLVESR